MLKDMRFETIQYLGDRELEMLLDNLTELHRQGATDLDAEQLAKLLTQLGRPTEAYELGSK